MTSLPGMGAIAYPEGVAFRVWAPNASAVYVVGTFNDWAETANPLRPEEQGFWYGQAEGAAVGHVYRFVVHGPGGGGVCRGSIPMRAPSRTPSATPSRPTWGPPRTMASFLPPGTRW